MFFVSKKLALFVFVFCLISVGGGGVFAEESSMSRDQIISELGPVFVEGDRVEIKIYREEDLTGVYEVDWAGNITFPLVGTIYVENLEVDALRETLIEKLSLYLIEPQVQIKRLERREKMEMDVITVSVLGQVNRQGSFECDKGETLMSAISRAGGFAPSAQERKIRIVRRLNAGDKDVFFIDGAKVIAGEMEDPVLKDGDMVFVPESFF